MGIADDFPPPIARSVEKFEMFDTKPRNQIFLDKSGDKLILRLAPSKRLPKRPNAPKPKRRDDFRAESSGQITTGRAGGPFPVSNDGRLIDNPELAIHLCFRSPVDKVSERDYFKQARINRLRHTETPTPPSLGHIAFTMASTLGGTEECAFGKTDRAVAYKNLAIGGT